MDKYTIVRGAHHTSVRGLGFRDAVLARRPPFVVGLAAGASRAVTAAAVWGREARRAASFSLPTTTYRCVARSLSCMRGGSEVEDVVGGRLPPCCSSRLSRSARRRWVDTNCLIRPLSLAAITTHGIWGAEWDVAMEEDSSACSFIIKIRPRSSSHSNPITSPTLMATNLGSSSLSRESIRSCRAMHSWDFDSARCQVRSNVSRPLSRSAATAAPSRSSDWLLDIGQVSFVKGGVCIPEEDVRWCCTAPRRVAAPPVRDLAAVVCGRSRVGSTVHLDILALNDAARLDPDVHLVFGRSPLLVVPGRLGNPKASLIDSSMLFLIYKKGREKK